MYTKKLREEVNNFDVKERKKIFLFVQEVLQDMLDLEKDEIKMDSLLIDDLGMSSIDMLDLIFNLEEKFKISIPRSGIREGIREVIPDDEFSKDGLITQKGLELLEEFFGGDAKGLINHGLKLHEIERLFSVQSFIELAITQLLEKNH